MFSSEPAFSQQQQGPEISSRVRGAFVFLLLQGLPPLAGFRKMTSPAGPGQLPLTLTPWFCSLLCTTPPPPELEHQLRCCRNAAGTHKGLMQPPRPHPQVRSGAQAVVPSDSASEKTCPVWSLCPASGRFPRKYQAAPGRGFYSVC